MRRSGLILLVSFSLAAMSFAGDNRWTSNGPYGGMFGSFCFHPQKNKLVFASGWSGGLLRSRDGGMTWERLDVIGGNMVVRIHPRNPRTIIAASGSVFRSTDEGATWELLADYPFQNESLNDMEFHPTDPQTLYGVAAGYREGGVYKSTDGGRTWQAKGKGLDYGSEQGYPCLEVDPTNGNIVYVILPSRKVFKTTDGAESWAPATKGIDFQPGDAVTALAISPEDPRTLYAGGFGGVFKTTDSGTRWVKTECGGVWGLTVDAKNPQNVYGAGGDVWKSTDHGETWGRSTIPGVGWLHGLAVHPAKSNLLLAGAHGEGILRSQDGGRDWQVVNTGVDAQNVVRLVSLPGRPNHMFAVGGTILLFESRDGGQTWQRATLSEGEDRGEVKDIQVHSSDPNLILAGCGNERGALAISTDAGRTWQFRSPYANGFNIAVDPRDRNIIFQVLHYDANTPALGMAKTTDMGRTWQLINKGLSDKSVMSIAIDPRNGSNVFAGTNEGRIFKSTNGGLNWRECSPGLYGGWVTRIAVHPSDSGTVFASTSAGTFKSTDAGASWTRKNDVVYAFGVVDSANPHTVFAGGFGGLMVSTDDGETWSTFDTTGLGPFDVFDLLIDSSNPNRYHIGTDRGVFSYTRKGAPGGPVIEQLSPSSGKPGDAVTINGQGFGQLQSDSKVRFGAVDAGSAQAWSDTSIKVTVPSGVQTGPVTIVVLNKKSNPYEFIVLPASGNVYPTSGPAKGGTRVTILAPSGTSGTQFNVLFGATVAGNVRFTQPNVITCDSPPGSGTVDVKVTSSVTSTTVGTFAYY